MPIKHRHYHTAFTLIEVMVVVVIMAILAAIIMPRVMNRPDQAKIVAAKQDIRSIENAMDLYKLDNGDYPSTAEGIAALIQPPQTTPRPDNWNGPYLKGQLPKDPWGHTYHYANPGQHGEIDIYSDGKHKVIGNWQNTL